MHLDAYAVAAAILAAVEPGLPARRKKPRVIQTDGNFRELQNIHAFPDGKDAVLYVRQDA